MKNIEISECKKHWKCVKAIEIILIDFEVETEDDGSILLIDNGFHL